MDVFSTIITLTFIFQALESTGLRKKDPRLKEMMKHLSDLQTKLSNSNGNSGNVDNIGRKEFKE